MATNVTGLVRWEGGSDAGLVRRRNEDAWGAVALEGRRGEALFAVADGMGGLPGGNIASRLAVEAVLAEGARLGDGAAAPDVLRAMFRSAQTALAAEARLEPGLGGMGTTLTVLLVRQDGAWVGHVGDSRLEWQRGGEICLVTEDHSLAWDLVESGLLDPDAAEQDPAGSILTRHLGPAGEVAPDIFERPLLLEAGDRLLLTTDGLGKVVPTPEVAQIVRRGTIEEVVRALIGRANLGGAPDNVTALVIEAVAPVGPRVGGLAWSEPRYRWLAED